MHVTVVSTAVILGHPLMVFAVVNLGGLQRRGGALTSVQKNTPGQSKGVKETQFQEPKVIVGVKRNILSGMEMKKNVFQPTMVV